MSKSVTKEIEPIKRYEFAVGIFNSRIGLFEWCCEELLIQQDPKLKDAIETNYRKIPINV